MNPLPSRTPPILVVDHDANVRSFVRRALEEVGCAVAEASSGRAAVNYLTSDSPQATLIVADLLMPEMSGWELAAIAQAVLAPRALPVVLMSRIPPAYRVGGEPVLIKPDDADSARHFANYIVERVELARLAPSPQTARCDLCGAETALPPMRHSQPHTFCRGCGAPLVVKADTPTT